MIGRSPARVKDSSLHVSYCRKTICEFSSGRWRWHGRFHIGSRPGTRAYAFVTILSTGFRGIASARFHNRTGFIPVTLCTRETPRPLRPAAPGGVVRASGRMDSGGWGGRLARGRRAPSSAGGPDPATRSADVDRGSGRAGGMPRAPGVGRIRYRGPKSLIRKPNSLVVRLITPEGGHEPRFLLFPSVERSSTRGCSRS